MKIDVSCLSACRLARVVLAGLACLVITGLAACNDPATRNAIDDASQKARQGLEEIKHPPAATVKRYDPLVISDKVWAGETAIKMHRGIPLPDRFEAMRGFALVASAPMSLEDIGKSISRQTGIPFYMADTGAGSISKASSGNGIAGASSGPMMVVAYEGPLSGFLERVAATFGVSWHFDGSSITVKRFETRVFNIESLPGTQSIQDGMQDDTSSSGSGGSSSSSSSSTNTVTQNSKFTIDMKSQMDEMGAVVTSMLGGVGSIVVSPTLGTVTVTTTPEVMRLVADYIAQENKKISRQIAVNIEIYSVNLSQGLDFSVAFTGALKALSRNSITGVTAPAAAGNFTGAGLMNVAILNSKDVGSATDLFKALSAIGDTTKVAKFPVITLNNRPVARRVGQDIGYLSGFTQTASATAGAGPTVSTTTGTVHQGFSVQLTPRLLDDGRILLQYSLSIIDLLKLSCFSTSGLDCTGATTAASSSLSGTAAQIPTTANRLFVQQSVLNNGATLIIGGAEEDDTVQNAQGVGDPFNPLLGGGQSNSRTHTMIFFALTPQVMESPHEEHG